jgi:hypothetical protein
MQMPAPTDYSNEPSGTYNQKYHKLGDKIYEIHNVIVHRFKVGDVEDPDLYAAEPLINWQKSEMGEWVMSHALEVPVWHRLQTPMDYHFTYAITAKLASKDFTYWTLKWGNDIDKTIK